MLTYVKVWMDTKEYGKKPDAALFGKLSGFIIVPKLCSNSHSNVKAKPVCYFQMRSGYIRILLSWQYTDTSLDSILRNNNNEIIMK